MKKQTAVEWLVEKILQKVQNYEDGDVETEEDPFIVEYVNRYNFNVDLTKFVEQAKEMEKEQQKEWWAKGYHDGYEAGYESTETIVTEYRDGSIQVDEFKSE